MSATFLRQNQTSSEKIKQQKRDWYYRNRKKVLKQQKTNLQRKETKKEWYARNKKECIQNAIEWIKDNPEQRQLHIQKYVQKNSAKTKFWKPYNIPDHMQLEWIENFGRLETFDPSKGKFSKHLLLKLQTSKSLTL